MKTIRSNSAIKGLKYRHKVSLKEKGNAGSIVLFPATLVHSISICPFFFFTFHFLHFIPLFAHFLLRNKFAN